MAHVAPSSCSAAIEAFYFLGGEKRKGIAKSSLEKEVGHIDKELAELESRKKVLTSRKKSLTKGYYSALKQHTPRKK